MRKVIIPFDGGRFSESSILFSINLNKSEPIILTGIFFSKVDFLSFFLFPPSIANVLTRPPKELEKKDIEKNIERFVERCRSNNIEYKIHEDIDDYAIPQLTKETRFADLMIIGSEIFNSNISEKNSNSFLKDTLQHTECPVLVVPEKFYSPSQNILAYDGSASSVFAIKQFAYLFPELCNHKTILVYASEETDDIPAQQNIEELAASHFNDLAITLLNSGGRKNFSEWVLKHENPLLISGSFGRSGFSSLFTKSFVTNIIEAHKTHVFIAHQ
jgi:hypothetical protein